jgi:hypothetical protein
MKPSLIDINEYKNFTQTLSDKLDDMAVAIYSSRTKKDSPYKTLNDQDWLKIKDVVIKRLVVSPFYSSLLQGCGILKELTDQLSYTDRAKCNLYYYWNALKNATGFGVK